MRLHHYAHSSASFRMRIVAALKGIDLNYVSVDMPGGEQRSDSYAALNPQKMLPCLELDDGQVIAQSLAIIAYLDVLYPEPNLWPSDPVARAQAHSLCLMIACETAPLQAKIVQRYLVSDCDVDPDKIPQWITHWIYRGFRVVETFLANRAEKTTFAMSETPGIVEAFVVPQRRNCDRFGIDMSDFPLVNTLNEKALSDPRIMGAHPDNWL